MRRGPFLAILLTPTAVVALTALIANAFVDPLWMVPQLGARPGLRYCPQDERTNKINRAVYGHLDAAGVLFGSSRSTFLDTRVFRAPVFNMAVNGVRAVELAELLDVFKRHVGAPSTVYVGTDFYGYLYEPGDDVFLSRLKARERISTGPFYRIGNLLDWSVLDYSAKTFWTCSSREMKEPTYDYSGARFGPLRTRDAQALSEQFKFFEQIYREPPDPAYRKYLLALRAVSPGSRFVIYIPPISTELFQAIIDAGRLPDYLEWLRCLVDVFGSVIQFSGKNAFTSDPANFFDHHHVYSNRTAPMVRILDGQAPADPDGFGRLLTRDNIESYASELRQ